MVKHKFVKNVCLVATFSAATNLVAMNPEQNIEPKVDDKAATVIEKTADKPAAVSGKEKGSKKSRKARGNNPKEEQAPAAKKEEPTEPKVEEATPIDLSQSNVSAANSATIQLYTQARLKHVEDKNKQPLIAHVVNLNNELNWENLILLGFNEGDFKAEDIVWVISEFSNPYTLDKKQAECLFDYMLNVGAVDSRKAHLLPLFTKTSLPQSSYVSDELLAKLGRASHSEHHNVLTNMVEKGQLAALNKILKKFPELVTKLIDEAAVTRKEYAGKTDDKAWFKNEYIYKHSDYTLINWLLREKARFLQGQRGGAFYVEAGKIILENAAEVLKETNSIFELKQVLFKEGHVSKELDEKISTKFNKQKS